MTGLSAGMIYTIYIDDTGTLQAMAGETFDLMATDIELFALLIDANGNQIVVADNHDHTMASGALIYLHEVVGTIILNENNGANIVLSGTQKISIAGDDEIIEPGKSTPILDSSGVGKVFHQMYTNASGKWVQYDVTDTFTGVYNNAGTITAIDGSKYGAYRLYVAGEELNTGELVFIAVIDNAQYNDLATAQTAVTDGAVAQATGELKGLDIAQLGYVIYEQSTNSIAEATIEKTTLRQGVSTAGSSVAALISTVTTNFDTVLGVVDTNVQQAFESIDDWGRTTRNAIALLDTRADEIDVSLRTNSNALLYSDRVNSNALLLGDRTNSNALLFAERVDSNAKLFLTRNNSNALVWALDPSNPDGVAGAVRANSNALVFAERVDSTAIKVLDSYLEPTKIFTGFGSWSDSGDYYDTHTTGSFTLYRGGTGYIKNKAVTWSGNQSVTGLATGATYWLYINSSGVLSATSTPSSSLFTDNIMLFEMLRTPNDVAIVVKENHPYNFPSTVSSYLHSTINAIINGTGANLEFVSSSQVGIDGADTMSDHGLNTTVADSGGGAVTFYQVYIDDLGKWEWYQTSDTFAARYNNGGTVTDPGSGYFTVYRLYVSKDDLNSSTARYFAVIDTAAYETLSTARGAIAQNTVAAATNELMRLEMAQLGFIIYSSDDGILDVIVSKDTLRFSSHETLASLTTLEIANFNGALNNFDVTVQQAMDKLDDWSITTSDAIVLLDARADATDVSLRTNSNALLALKVGQGADISSLQQQLNTIDHGPAHIHMDTTTTMSYNWYLGTAPAYSHKLFVHGGAPVTLDGSGLAIHFSRETADTLIDIDAGTTLVFENIVLKDFLARHVALGAGADVIFGTGTTVELADDDAVPTSNLIKLTAQGTVLLAGRGHTLDISTQANALEVKPGAQLTLHDITLFGLHDYNMRCLSPSARIVLNDADLLMTNNYTFSEGAMTFSGDVIISGRGHTFAYQSAEQSVITPDAVLTFDKGVTLSYDAGNYERAASNRQALALQTASAALHFDNCTLHSTYTGLQLTKGQLFIDNLVTFSSQGRALSEAITIGDGTAAGDVALQLLAGAELSVFGKFDYRNTN